MTPESSPMRRPDARGRFEAPVPNDLELGDSVRESKAQRENDDSEAKVVKEGGVLPLSEFRNITRPKVISLALIFAGAQVVQELVSEAIFTQYVVRRETYEVAMIYSCFQQLGTVVVALLIMAWAKSGKNSDRDAKPQRDPNATPSWPIIALLAILIFASTALPNWAVEYVYFPAKVVAKSTKLVPTMFVSVLMGNSKRFTMVDYCSAILLCLGSAGFALNSGRVEVDEKGVEKLRENLWFGLLLLTTASFADALVPNLQQKVMKAGASAEMVALRVNSIGAAWVFVFLFVSGAVYEWAFTIFAQTPELFILMLTGSATLGIAVLAYTMLIREAGSVVAVAIATARKVLTLTLSYVVFPGDGKTFGMSHAISALAVALGMALGPLYERWRVWRIQNGEPDYARI